MLKAVDVFLWGTNVGSVSVRAGDPIARFQYSDELLDVGIELSPLMMPLARKVYSFPNLAIGSFHGLPGLLSDSLPDKFGNKVIAAWMKAGGRTAEDFNAIDRLAYAGKRGMGALEYQPALLDGGDLSNGKCRAVIAEVREAVRAWPRFAAEAEVRDEFAAAIGKRLLPS